MIQLLYGATIFLSACLVFFIQPLIAKAMLPHFGGAGVVWITTILFFQIVLLLGYGYAYLLSRFFKEKHQAAIHLVILCVSLSFIPIYLHTIPSLGTLWLPVAVLLLLSKSVLVPCVIICASSPLLQHWYCHIRHSNFPYQFYAVSNAGSLIGLLGYPLLLEPFIGLKLQRLIWSNLYGIYVILCMICLSKLFSTTDANKIKCENYSLAFGLKITWLILTFLSSALLLSTTQFLVQNVINLPLLWVLPLTLYLISYIVVFAKAKSYSREFWFSAFLVWLMLFLYLLYNNLMFGINMVIVMLALLYSACMICHGELIRSKPQNHHLTLFYLLIALGGVLGGIFSNIVALLIFVNWWDLFLPLIVLNVAIVYTLVKHYLLNKRKWDLFLGVASTFIAIGFCTVLVHNLYNPSREIVAEFRNFYGKIMIYDVKTSTPSNAIRSLKHGIITHGLQFKLPAKSQLPTTYYGYNSGVGVAFEYLRAKHKPLKVGIIGLGCGTIAAYGEKEDQFTFYEIDPDMIKVAKNDFTFLANSKATVNVVLGDARMSLTRNIPTNEAQKFDLLVIDAFSGDAIPSHLLTKEAMEVYLKHLAPNGILALHTSNIYIKLLPLTKALGIQSGCPHYWLYNGKDSEKGVFSSSWALISCDPGLVRVLAKHPYALSATQKAKERLWTDDFNTILPLLRWN